MRHFRRHANGFAKGWMRVDGLADVHCVGTHLDSQRDLSDHVARVGADHGDADLIEPIATLPLDVAAVAEGEWDGQLPERYRFRTGDQLLYVLRAYGADGAIDETWPQTLQLVLPEEAESGNQRLREATERSRGTAMSAEQAETQRLLDNVFAGSGLRQQNIPLNGSRVRIQGRNLPEQATLTIDGDSYPVDLDRKFVAEYLMPVGSHDFQVASTGRDGDYAHTLTVDVTGEYFLSLMFLPRSLRFLLQSSMSFSS